MGIKSIPFNTLIINMAQIVSTPDHLIICVSVISYKPESLMSTLTFI